ncbi:hypothetical protein [Egicoccus sp. AB-alg2]|uniref:hypothetical protein n=1 Tax=Egicoccus sp. AB-alg2 TaxID=3242693 RepID=UPI00359E28CD
MEPLDKPDELLALHDVTAVLFDTLRDWFDVPDRVSLSLQDVDAAVTELSEPVMVAAMAMRKLQALRLLSQPGVRTSTDVVVSIVQDLDRALLHAPSLHLERRARLADWDAALEELTTTPEEQPAHQEDPAGEGEDAETAAFRALHARLHEAVHAVVQASDGQIRYFV